MRHLLFAAFVCGVTPTLAATPGEVLASNTRAIVYLEVADATGRFVDSGTGFIVSHDGYIATAAHLKPEPSQKLWAVIGQREGTRFPLQAREADDQADVALWQLPQSASCRSAVTIATSQVHVLDRTVVIGFPGRDGITPAPVNISNLSDDQGFYKADGFLRNGYSGGPVFNENGKVVATIHSGTPAGGNNVFVPISFVINLLKKRGVKAGIDDAVPFENSCYALCRAPSHGIESWSSETAWLTNSGEVPGGHTRRGECDKLIAATLAGNSTARIDLVPGEGTPQTGMWEDSHKDSAGQMHYTYYCRGTLRSGPIYVQKQSPACGLWD